MKVIVLASRKGGAAKSTMSAHLSVQAERAGYGPVAIIDLDPQATLAHWWNRRKADTPTFAQVGNGGLVKTLSELDRAGVNLVVIDTPGRGTEGIPKVIALADLVIVPVTASPNDLWAISETLNMTKEAGVQTVFVICNSGVGKLTGQAAVALSQHGTVAGGEGGAIICKHRQDWRASMADGRTVMELPRPGPSADEVRELWIYIRNMLEGNSEHGKAARRTKR